MYSQLYCIARVIEILRNPLLPKTTKPRTPLTRKLTPCNFGLDIEFVVLPAMLNLPSQGRIVSLSEQGLDVCDHSILRAKIGLRVHGDTCVFLCQPQEV